MIYLVLTISILALSINSAWATNSATADTPNETALVDQSPNQVSTDTSYLTGKSYKIEKGPNIAAGESTTVINISSSIITRNQIKDAASDLKTFVDTNHRLPNYVTVAGQQVTIPQFLLLLNENLQDINNGQNNPLTIKDVFSPTNPSESVKSGDIQKNEYLQIFKNMKKFVDNNGRIPNYVTSSLGKIRYESLVYISSKILNFYTSNSRLPNYVSISSWVSQSTQGTTITDSSLQKYLQPSANCQSTSSTIKTLAESITAGITSTYSKAGKIFNWVRDSMSYSYYYNTKKGALGALSSRSANCCDHSHLVNALARAVGIPGRYIHVSGHVYSQLYIDGRWYNADAINNNNYFGQTKSTANILGIYAELPF